MNRLTDRLSSLTPLLQGKQVNYLPMMVGALKHQGIDNDMIQSILESCIRKMPVGDLGEKLYPKSTFDEYYIHKTNYYLGQLKKRSFEDMFQDLLDGNHDYGVSYEFAGFLRIHYALQSEDELMTAEALAFLDLSLSKEKTHNETIHCAHKDCLLEAKEFYELDHSRNGLIKLLTLIVLQELKQYINQFDETLSKVNQMFEHLPQTGKLDQDLSINEIKTAEITSLNDPLLIVAKDFIHKL